MDPVNDTPMHAEYVPDLTQAVSDAGTLAREQVQAAWQLHLEKVREQLESGWLETLQQIYAERFHEVEERLRERYNEALQLRAQQLANEQLEPARAQASAESRAEARSQAWGEATRASIEKLNNVARRLRMASSRDEVKATLISSASEFSPSAVVLEESELDLTSAPALANALESKDTVVAEATAGELSEAVLQQLRAPENSRVFLIPLVAHDKALGVMAAVSPEAGTDVSSLELLATLAAPHLELPPEPVIIEPIPPKPGWSDLSRPEQETHLRAQRFARNRVAELLLNHINRVRDARAAGNLYGMFRVEIEAARSEFRREFFETSPSMVDYLHVEFIRTLARDHADALGPDYPGPLL